MESHSEAQARFTDLFEEHSRAVLGFAVRRVGAADAADVLAECFVVVWRRLDDVPSDCVRARGWVLGVARRIVANQRRGEDRRARLAELLKAHIQIRTPLQPDPGLVAAVDTAMNQLHSTDREILYLAAWEELAPREIAQVLGLHPNVVRVRLHRARRRLQALLEAGQVVERPRDLGSGYPTLRTFREGER